MDYFNTAENRWEQELWVRVENTTFTTACFDTKLVGKLIINKLPELTTNYLELEQDNTVFNLNNLRADLLQTLLVKPLNSMTQAEHL